MLPAVESYFALFLIVLAVLFLVVRSLAGRRPEFDVVGLVGSTGEAMDTFSDSGTITVRGEIWKATAARGLVQRGDKVRVVRVGPELTLVVEKLG